MHELGVNTMNSKNFNFEKFVQFCSIKGSSYEFRQYDKANVLFYLREILSLAETADLRRLDRMDAMLRFHHYVERKSLALGPWMEQTFANFVDNVVGEFIAYAFNPQRYLTELAGDGDETELKVAS